MNRIFTLAVTRRRDEDEKLRRNGQGFVNNLGHAPDEEFRSSSQPDIFMCCGRRHRCFSVFFYFTP